MIGRPIRATIPDQEDRLDFESVPDAVAACRRYFMRGGRETCEILQGRLIYRINVDPTWICKSEDDLP